MEGMSALEPFEHSVLDVDLDGGPMEGRSGLGPLEHSVLDIDLDGRPMEGTLILEPLEHSVLDIDLAKRPMEGMLVLEPLEHLVLDVTSDRGSGVGLSALEPLEHSVLGGCQPAWQQPVGCVRESRWTSNAQGFPALGSHSPADDGRREGPVPDDSGDVSANDTSNVATSPLQMGRGHVVPHGRRVCVP